MKVKKNILKEIFFSIFIFLIFFSLIEIIGRFFIFSITKNLDTFAYGFNKNIQINLNHLIKLKIEVINLKKVNDSIQKFKIDKSKQKQEKNIWIFGGSTTKGNICGDNASSWPKELEKLNNKINIKNFSEYGIDSHGSLQIIQKLIINQQILPDVIIWTHKFNEINVIYQGKRTDPNNLKIQEEEYKKRIFYYQIVKIDHLLKSNLIFYKIFKSILISTNRKIERNISKERIHPKLTINDFKFAAKNFEINTGNVIEFSEKIGVKNFILLSLPSRKDFEKKMSNLFFDHYYNSINNLTKNYSVKFLDLSDNNLFLDNESLLFCDEVHKTRKANIIIARLVNLYIKNALNFIK